MAARSLAVSTAVEWPGTVATVSQSVSQSFGRLVGVMFSEWVGE